MLFRSAGTFSFPRPWNWKWNQVKTSLRNLLQPIIGHVTKNACEWYFQPLCSQRFYSLLHNLSGVLKVQDLLWFIFLLPSLFTNLVYDMNYWLIANNNLICDELIYKLRPFKLKVVGVYFYTYTYKRIILVHS